MENYSHKSNYYENYIYKLEDWFKFFQDEMIKIYSLKKENTDIKVIEKQLEILKKAKKHIENYYNNFLKYLKPEIKRKLKFVRKWNIYANSNIINLKTKKYLTFSEVWKEKVKYFNDYLELLILVLEEIEKILNKQIDFIKRNNFVNNNQWKIKKFLVNQKQKFNKKVYWDYNKLLEKEEELLSAFFEIFEQNDLEKIDDLEELIEWYKKMIFYLLGWATLTIIPETPITDIASIIPYWLATKHLNNLKNNSLKWSKYKSRN